LNRWANAVEKCEILFSKSLATFPPIPTDDAYNLPIPRLINCSQMLRRLLHQRQHNQAQELVRDTRFDDVFNSLDKENC
jgi:hypothetical protein